MIEPTSAWIWIGVGIVLIAGSAFFSSSEIAIFSLPTGWIEARAAEDRRARILRRLRDDPHRLLVTLLVGNNVVNVAISSLTTAAFVELLPRGLAITAATVVASAVVLVFGEIVPKSFGLGNAERWALAVARPVDAVGLALFPAVVLFDVVTRRVSVAVGGDRRIERPYTAVEE